MRSALITEPEVLDNLLPLPGRRQDAQPHASGKRLLRHAYLALTRTPMQKRIWSVK
jgi:hypothetical protein